MGKNEARNDRQAARRESDMKKAQAAYKAGKRAIPQTDGHGKGKGKK